MTGTGTPVGGMPIRRTWSESDRRLPRTVVRPVQRLMTHEAGGGIVMLAAAALAILWANSPWSDAYVDLWATPLRVELGDVVHLDHLSLQSWVNDALMAVFFLLVGVELKREIVHGELRDLRAIALPVAAALGGMVVPAAIYTTLNAGGPGADGWAVPMATDIAFAVGVVTLLGPRVPTPAKIFLLTLAVADDLGAIVVIAAFYTGTIAWGWLAVAFASLGAVVLMRRGDVQALAPYLAVGAVVWFALLESGVHATLAGVALGLLTPAWPLRSPRRFPADARRLIDRFERSYHDRAVTAADFETAEQVSGELARLTRESTSPLERLERGLTPWVTYVIVPTFAFANAGVAISGDTLGDLFAEPVTAGVLLGLVLGKPVGIVLASAAAVRLGLGRLPEGTTWRQMVGIGATAGIGFTVALFVTSLAFPGGGLADAAKVGILAASVVSGTLGYLVLRMAAPVPAGVPTAAAGPVVLAPDGLGEPSAAE